MLDGGRTWDAAFNPSNLMARSSQATRLMHDAAPIVKPLAVPRVGACRGLSAGLSRAAPSGASLYHAFEPSDKVVGSEPVNPSIHTIRFTVLVFLHEHVAFLDSFASQFNRLFLAGTLPDYIRARKANPSVFVRILA